MSILEHLTSNIWCVNEEDKVQNINEGKEQEDATPEAFVIPSAPPVELENAVLFYGDERI